MSTQLCIVVTGPPIRTRLDRRRCGAQHKRSTHHAALTGPPGSACWSRRCRLQHKGAANNVVHGVCPSSRQGYDTHPSLPCCVHSDPQQHQLLDLSQLHGHTTTQAAWAVWCSPRAPPARRCCRPSIPAFCSPGLAPAAPEVGWSSGCACSSASCRATNVLTCSSTVPVGSGRCSKATCEGELDGCHFISNRSGTGGFQLITVTHHQPVRWGLRVSSPRHCQGPTLHTAARPPTHHEQAGHSQRPVLAHAVAAPDGLPLEAGVERGLAKAAGCGERGG